MLKHALSKKCALCDMDILKFEKSGQARKERDSVLYQTRKLKAQEVLNESRECLQGVR